MLYSKKMCWGPRRQHQTGPVLPHGATAHDKEGQPTIQQSVGLDSPEESTHSGGRITSEQDSAGPRSLRWQYRTAQCGDAQTGSSAPTARGAAAVTVLRAGQSWEGGLGRTMSCRAEQRRAKQMRGAYAEEQRGVCAEPGCRGGEGGRAVPHSPGATAGRAPLRGERRYRSGRAGPRLLGVAPRGSGPRARRQPEGVAVGCVCEGGVGGKAVPLPELSEHRADIDCAEARLHGGCGGDGRGGRGD